MTYSHFILIAFLLLNCSHPVEFHKLDIDKSQEIAFRNEHNQPNCFLEYFVIKNPPGDYKKLRQVIDTFNTKTKFLPDSLKTYEYYRFFYKETQYTPRTYKEHEKNSGYFEGQDYIEKHWRDMLLKQNWSKSKSAIDIFYTFYKNEEIIKGKSDHISVPLDCTP